MSKEILEDVLSKASVRELWTCACGLALPVVPQHYVLPAVLAPVLYMLRWNKRRGKGQFVQEFGNPSAKNAKDRAARASTIAERLSEDGSRNLLGFDNPVSRQILADLLLAYCFENRKHSEGRDEPIQRIYPTHYFASWIDLPDMIAHLRGVPELVVSALDSGTGYGYIARPGLDSSSTYGERFQSNPLLSALGDGVYFVGDPANRESDRFREEASVGIDQLLTIRVAQCLGLAPNPQGRGSLPPCQPAAQRAHHEWYEDMNIFLRAYGHMIPRLTLVPMLETSLSVGLTTVFLSTLTVMSAWEQSGYVISREEQSPYPVFVDCSSGVDDELRRLSEESMEAVVRQISKLTVQFMAVKLLMQQAQSLRLPGFGRNDNPHTNPSESLTTLGSLLFDQSKESERVRWSLDEKCTLLADRLSEDSASTSVNLLEDRSRHPVWHLAEFIVSAMGDKLQNKHLRGFLDSCLMVNEPNGIAQKRVARAGRRNVERRTLVLSNTTLDYLVHRHLRQGKKRTPLRSLSVNTFIDILRERYGFWIVQCPRGLDVPAEALRRNRVFLERRLRDLGLLVGANDAESMKRLRPRFKTDAPEQVEPRMSVRSKQS